MHPFFDLVERTGLVEKRVAILMGYERTTYAKAKAGIIPVTSKFARRATHALNLLGLRKQDGTPYTVSDLFIMSRLSPVGGESSLAKSEVA